MKQVFPSLTLSLFITIVIFCSCKKEDSCETCLTNQPAEPTGNINKSPVAVAGFGQIITLPANSILLNGSGSYDPGGRIAEFRWAKISGPSSFSIMNTDSAQTMVTDLVEGVYQFELTVTDSLGLADKDTTAVTVKKYPNEISFNNQVWQCWWGCWIEIPNLYSSVPSGIFFRVFIKRDNTNTWEEAIYGSQTSNYGFSVDTNSLIVYMGLTTNADNDTPDIKIVY